jgi:putative spermidine/putrescine transport system ATP-binding protein
MSAVEFNGVSQRFASELALNNFSLKVEEGSLTTLLGPSGCGKTTALRLLAGFLTPSEGEILVDGKDISKTPASKRGFGMVFQSYSLFPHLTTEENIAFGLKLKRYSETQINKRVSELLEITALQNQAKKFPHQLSGGQQQRVALARALAIEPKLLLLDEPLSALDAAVREQLRVEIRSLQQSSGVTTVFVTHDQQEALALSDQVAVMSKGKLEQIGDPVEIYSNPSSQFVAEFVGASNRLPVVRSGGSSWSGMGFNFAGQDSGTRGIAYVRPEELEPVEGKDFSISTKTFQGGHTRLELVSGQASLVVEVSSQLATTFNIGDQISLKCSRTDPFIAVDPK